MAVPHAVIILILMATKCIAGHYEYPSSYQYQYSGSSEENYYQPKHHSSGEDSYYRRAPPNRPTYFYSDYTSNEISGEVFEQRPTTARESSKKEFTYVETDEPPLFGPRNWGEINTTCDGQFQSPINLLNNDFSGTIAPRLEFKGFTTTPAGATLTNNGHSVVIKWLPSTGLPAAISGGVLKSTYIVDNAHFHWGRTDSTGSEHFIASRQFSLELHIVCFNSQYGSVASAENEKGGLAVLAIIFQAQRGAATLPFIKNLPSVMTPNTTVNIDAFALSDLIKQRKFKYFSYSGSLTTPNCSETVTWIVSTRIIPVNPNDIVALRKIKDEHGRNLVTNVRPIQNSNKRKVTLQSTF